MQTRSTIGGLVLALCLAVGLQAQDPAAFQDSKVDVGGYRLQFHILAGKSPTIVFEAGGGDNSSTWDGTVQTVRRRTGARIVTYDRAGLGASDRNPAPYTITHEVEALERGLKQLHVDGDLILVGHSYGGFLVTLFAARNPSTVKGVVLVDANLPQFFTDSLVASLSRAFAARREEMRKDNAQKFATMDGVLTGFPETVRTMRAVTLPAGLRITDIVAEHPPMPPPDDAGWRPAHEAFDKAAPNRRGVLATGSGHYVMKDRPELVTDEIAAMYQSAR